MWKYYLSLLLFLALPITPAVAGDSNPKAEPESPSPWAARLIMGYHQAGAAASDFSQNVIIDFYVVRAISGDNAVWQSSFNSWGNVRIASTPRQLNTPLINLASGLLTPTSDNNPAKTNVNELALAGEFQTGIEINLSSKGKRDKGQVHSIIGYFGATGSFESPVKHISLYEVPSAVANQWTPFHNQFPSIQASTGNEKQFIGFTIPDRDRFYRQYGFGYRYSKYNPQQPSWSPQTYSVTIGQDEAVTGGTFRGSVLRVEGFYPLPVTFSDKKLNFLYVFATASLRLARGEDLTPLVLKPAPDGTGKDNGGNTIAAINAYDPNVSIIKKGSNRDNYRLGIGVDLMNLLGSLLGK
jgi:hypothetical protein